MGIHKGTRTIEFDNHILKKKSSVIDVKGEEKDRGDNTFKRLEYWGIQSSYLIHYLGDHQVYVPFEHRNCRRNTKPFVRSAPHVKEKV